MSKKIVTYSIIGSFLIFTGIKAETSSFNNFQKNHSSQIETYQSINHLSLVDDKTNLISDETFVLINIFNRTSTNFLLEQIFQETNPLRFTHKKNSNRTLIGFISNLKI